MSLTTALNIAQNSLLNTQRQTSVVSRNMAEAYNPDYARRSAVLSSLAPGAQTATIMRATNAALFRQNLSALSGWTAQNTIVNGLDRLSVGVNGVDNASSPAVLLGQLQEALQIFSATPSSRSVAESSVEAARQLVASLTQGSQSIQSFRADMDREIATGVGELNGLLSEFKSVNDAVVSGTASGRDVLDALDRRDALLKKISEYIPISTITRANHDMMIVTSEGTTLFETVPRHVAFTPTPAYGAATTGSRIAVDGVPIAAGSGGNTSAGGTLAAMVQLRDSVSNSMQLQFDEMARGLNEAIPGLLTWTGNLADPGIAGRISINALIDPGQGGDPMLLRDGILTNQNPDGNAGFTDVLIGYLSALEAPRTFTTATGATVESGLMTYSAGVVSWFEDTRKTAAYGGEVKGALMARTAEALSNITSVNVEEEMALMLELEHSYAASARMLQMIDEMLAILLDAVR